MPSRATGAYKSSTRESDCRRFSDRVLGHYGPWASVNSKSGGLLSLGYFPGNISLDASRRQLAVQCLAVEADGFPGGC